MVVKADCANCETICVSSILCVLFTSRDREPLLWFMCPGCLEPIAIQVTDEIAAKLALHGATAMDSVTLEPTSIAAPLEGAITQQEICEFLSALADDESDFIARLQNY